MTGTEWALAILAIVMAMVAGAGWGMYHTERMLRMSHPSDDKVKKPKVIEKPDNSEGNDDNTTEIS